MEIPPFATRNGDGDATARTESVIFAGGCFWGVQGMFQHINGVRNAVSGYAGGASGTSNYASVSGGNTGHAESVRVTYDPSKVGYAQLLQVFFSVVHDPTQLNRQGPDRGSQYRSAVFVESPRQRETTLRYMAQLQAAHAFSAPIVTQVETGKRFYPAENYHQNYLVLRPGEAYIRFNDLPKVAELKRTYPTLYRAQPVLVATH
ncbi:peptide-methionine (S)-S-oxide reductase MsrA [Lysobacter sp. CA196]|uniref:peptide-methionine (S)-S-oxide reductase MsrA n=1 Tax=Lysobacter sp. CA196 TaxID=3455606 RepID=UPI003F8D1D6D